MKILTGKQFCKLLEQRGWRLKRVQGSHHIYAKSGRILVVPVHGNCSLKAGLQRSLLKLAGIDPSEL